MLMKKVIKEILKLILFIAYLVFSPNLRRFLNLRFNQLYSIWKSNEFKIIGENAYMQFPLYLFGGKHIIVGKNFSSDQRLRLDTFENYLGDKFNPEIIIGDNVSIQKDCHIGAINKIVIGNNVQIAGKVYICDHSHGEITIQSIKFSPAKRKLISKGAVIIEDNVWIGEGVAVLPNVTIGENSVVGANSVVTKSFPKNSIIGGIPAKLIRSLD